MQVAGIHAGKRNHKLRFDCQKTNLYCGKQILICMGRLDMMFRRDILFNVLSLDSA